MAFQHEAAGMKSKASWTLPASLHRGCSTGRRKLVLGLGLEIAGVMALVQLARRLTEDPIDHTSALHGWPFEELVGPVMDVLVILPELLF